MITEKQYRLLGPNRKMYLSATPGTLGGHRGRRVYGRFDCRAALQVLAKGGYKASRVFFADEPTAIAAGFRPCAVCMPAEYKLWKQETELTRFRSHQPSDRSGVAIEGETMNDLASDEAALQVLLSMLDVNRQERDHIEVILYCASDTWTDPNKQYVSLHNVMLGRRGAKRLSTACAEKDDFLIRHGAFELAIASTVGNQHAVVSDGKYIWLVDRKDLNWRGLPNDKAVELRAQLERAIGHRFPLATVENELKARSRSTR